MPDKPTVVLLHGLARRSSSMAGMRGFLERAGYPTWSVSYPSRRQSIAEAAAGLVERLRSELPDRPLCGVTHSLGGILIRHMADPALAWQRIVMLAPPNRGSQIALALRENALYRWFYGAAGQEVAVDAAAWPPPPAPFAVIAGTRGDALTNPARWLPRLFAPGTIHDGTVALDETLLPGAAAFRSVVASHTFIMNHPIVRQETLAFLERGAFDDL